MASIAQETIAPSVSAEELAALQKAVETFDREQLIWSSGFLAGLASPKAPSASAAVSQQAADTTMQPGAWHIFYATETGNSRRIAEKLAENAKLAGISTQLHDLRDVRPKSLKNVENAVFVLATHGIGEAPEGSEPFFDFWMSDKAPRFENLNFSVLSLGDSSYANFCEIGRTFDARLRELGGSAVIERIDCDLDFDTPSTNWTTKVIEYAQKTDPSTGRFSAPQLAAVSRRPSTIGSTRLAPRS